MAKDFFSRPDCCVFSWASTLFVLSAMLLPGDRVLTYLLFWREEGVLVLGGAWGKVDRAPCALWPHVCMLSCGRKQACRLDVLLSH